MDTEPLGRMRPGPRSRPLRSYGNAPLGAPRTKLEDGLPEGCRTGAADAVAEEITVSQERKAQVVAQATALLGRTDDQCRQVLAQIWDAAFEDGRLDALDELQDRFCVCMK